jgi:hypothetical protein
MTKTLKDFFEVYRPKSPDEQRFVDKHIVIKHKDRNGNGDDVFNATNVKKINRKKENHGYEPGDDEKVYEEVESIDELSSDLKARYSRRAADDRDDIDLRLSAGQDGDHRFIKGGKKEAAFKRISKNRTAGIQRAIKEDVEAVDEVSKDLVNRYLDARKADHPINLPLGQKRSRQYKSVDRAITKLYGPHKGVDLDKKGKPRHGSVIAATEEVDSVDEAAPYYSLEASKARMAKEKAREDAKKAKSDTGKAATQAKRDSKANQSHEIARHIETEVGNHYPDSDGFDAIAKKLRSHYGISSHAAIDHMDAAARKHLGAKSFSHYVDNFDKDYKKDNQHESAGQIDEVGDTKAGRAVLGSYINNRTKDIAGHAYEAGLRRDTGTKSKSYKKELAGRVGIERAVDKLTKPRKFRRYFGEELATSFIDKYVPELAETTALSNEDQLVTMLIDTGISEGIASDILMLHSSLDENNQRHLLAAIEAGEIDEVLDFAIQNRGE